MADMRTFYAEHVGKFSNKFIKVVLNDEEMSKIQDFVQEVTRQKASEKHHKIDGYKETTRFMTGTMGEVAVEKVLGIPFVDWSVGNSTGYHHPDIGGYKVGVKTVEIGKFPIIFKKNYYSQIFCVRSKKYSNVVYVCGLAEPAVLNQFQSDDLILDPNLRARGTKTGFYGFQYLKPITSLKNIEQYKVS